MRRSLLLNLAIFAPYAVVSKQPCFAAEGYDPVTEVEKKASSSIAKRINVAVGLLDKGRELQAKGDFVGALDYFTQVSYISTIRSFSLGFLVSDLMLNLLKLNVDQLTFSRAWSGNFNGIRVYLMDLDVVEISGGDRL